MRTLRSGRALDGGLGLVLVALVLGTLARIVPVMAADFPLNDGGLFLVMGADLRHAAFALPITTTYNLSDIPFAYPPLGLYLLGGLSQIGVDPIEVERWLPVMLSAAVIPFVYLIGRELGTASRGAAVAAIAYALIPRSYEWLIAGGGVTRALGILFAVGAIWTGMRLVRRRSWRDVFATGFVGGLAALSHPEAVLFAALSLVFVAAVRGRTWMTAMQLTAAGVIGLVVSAPWWITVVSRHGIDVLLGAAESRAVLLPNVLRLLIFGEFTGAVALDVFIGLGIVGLLFELARRRFLVPAWMAITVLLIPAAGLTFAMIPWSLLVAVAVSEALAAAAVALVPPRGLARFGIAVGLLGAAVMASLSIGYSVTSPTHALSAEQRQAMEWVDANLPADASVAVVTGSGWQYDAVSEWFPAIAHRHSVATVQGSEWTGRFVGRAGQHQILQDLCANRLADCVTNWAAQFALDVDYVFIPKGRLAGIASPHDCCPSLREDLARNFTVVYDGVGASIVRLLESTRQSTVPSSQILQTFRSPDSGLAAMSARPSTAMATDQTWANQWSLFDTPMHPH